MSGLGEPREVRLEARRLNVRVYDTRDGSAFEHLLVLMHGCGFTSQTFGALAASLPKTIRVVAFDFRGHGGTRAETIEDDVELSLQTLIDDAVGVINEMLGSEQTFVLCGHSMGGAVATRVAKLFVKQCIGLIMIDAVEGVVLKHIDAGEKAAAQIPDRFRTIDDAVRYCLTTSHNGHFSAGISTPDRLVPHPEGGFTWRTNVLGTSKYWREWFTGLSTDFLNAHCLKMLIMAGVENLDTPLAAGHMQGKYQLEVLAIVKAGHFVQEDAPGQTATVIGLFVNRVQAKKTSQKPGGMSAQEVIALSAKMRAGANVQAPPTRPPT